MRPRGGTISQQRLQRRIQRRNDSKIKQENLRQLMPFGIDASVRLDGPLASPGGIPEPLRWELVRRHVRQNWAMPAVTVAICTRDQFESLEACVRQFQASDYPNFEILIIDNSLDPVPAQELAQRVGIRCVRSHVPGLSRARNLALANARHEWIAFIGDNCRAERNWL